MPALPHKYDHRIKSAGVFLRGLNPASQYFSHAPGLGDAATGKMRLTRVEYFADRTYSVVAEMLWKDVEKFSRGGLVVGMYF